MRECQERHHRPAGRAGLQPGAERLPGTAVGVPGEQRVAVDEVQERPWLAAQVCEDVAVVDDVGVAALERTAARQGEDVAAAEEALETVIVDPDPEGVALVHSIGRMRGPGFTDAWIDKYIFPGAYAPALSEVLPAIERSKLWVTDIEILRLHYAHTLRHWRDRFMANRERAKGLYNERFCRMWEFYLATMEMSFRYLDHYNFQIQLAPNPHTLPLTRDYIIEAERAPAGLRLMERAAS